MRLNALFALLPWITLSLPTIAAESSPCVVAEAALRDFYGYVSPSEAKALKVCAGSSVICVLTDDGILSARTPSDLTGKPSPALLGLVQVNSPNQSACLAAIYSGGSAASWIFAGWRVEAGKSTNIKNFSSTQLNSDNISSDGLATLMLKAYAEKH
jgi:hypothetical protein